MSDMDRRLSKIESSLTPKQAVLLWMEEAHQHDSLFQYVASIKDGPDNAWPLYRLSEQAEASTRANMKGQPRGDVERAVRLAVRESYFLFHIHQQMNRRLMEEGRAHFLQAQVLAALLNHLYHDAECGRPQDRNRPSLKKRRTQWAFCAREFLRELFTLEKAAGAISDRYFDGHPVLWPKIRNTLDDLIETTLGFAELFAISFPSRRRKSVEQIDAVAISHEAAEAAPDLQAYIVDMAKAEVLDSMGEGQAAAEIVKRHV